MCIWPGGAAWLHTPELQRHCTLSWRLYSRLLVWPSSFLLYKVFLLLHFSKQQKKKHALLYYASKFLLLKVSFYSLSRWTKSTTSRYLVFFLIKKLKDFANGFYMFFSIVKVLWEIREQGLLSMTRSVVGFHCLPRLNHPSFKYLSHTNACFRVAIIN